MIIFGCLQIPHTGKKRKREERINLSYKDIQEAENVVISGSLVDWGNELIPLFTLAVRVETDTNIRIERIRNRETKKFGSRIEPGGDMYKQHLDFIAWASEYDTGDTNMRSKLQYDEWEKLLLCQRILLDGATVLDENYKIVLSKIR